MKTLIERQARVDGIYIEASERSMNRRMIVSLVMAAADNAEEGVCLRFAVPATQAAAWGERLGYAVTILVVDGKEGTG